MKSQELGGLSALLIGTIEELPGKHLQLTSAFSFGNQIPHWVNVPWKYPAFRTKKQSAKIKPLSHIGLIERGSKIKVLCYRE